MSNLHSRTRLWLSLRVFAGLGVVLGGTVASAQEPRQSVRLQGLLHDGTLVETGLEPDGQLPTGRSLSDFRWLSHEPGWFDSPGLTPLRILTLATGERFPARQTEPFQFSVKAVEGQGRGIFSAAFSGSPVVVPEWGLQSITAPESARDVVLSGWPLADDFWTHREGTLIRVETTAGGSVLAPAAGSHLRRQFELSAPLELELSVAWPKAGSGSLEVRLLPPEGEEVGDEAVAATVGLRLRQRGSRLTVERIGTIRVALAARAVRIPTGNSQSRLRITIDHGLTLSLNGRVLAQGRGDAGRLRLLSLSASGTPPAGQASDSLRSVSLDQAAGPVLIGCLVQTRAKRSDVRGVSGDRLSVLTHQGDQLYGQSVRMTPSEIQLKTEFGSVALPGIEVRSVRFPRPPRREYVPPGGDICRVRLAADSSTAFFGRQRPYELLGEVQLSKRGIRLRHPILQQAQPGEESSTRVPLSLPWPAIQKIEPLFRGEYRLLSTGPWHLGAKHLPAFSPPEPDGTLIRIPFELPEVTPGKAWLSLEVADLEPASENTLRATPNLNELRRGFLTTHVALNQVPCRTLNRHCEFLSPLGQPQRIRIPLPAGSLKEGRNLLQFQQNPSRTNPKLFDDCEVRRIALEFDAEP